MKKQKNFNARLTIVEENLLVLTNLNSILKEDMAQLLLNNTINNKFKKTLLKIKKRYQNKLNQFKIQMLKQKISNHK